MNQRIKKHSDKEKGAEKGKEKKKNQLKGSENKERKRMKDAKEGRN